MLRSKQLFIVIVLVLLSMLSGAIVSAEPQQQSGVTVSIVTRANLRSGPGTEWRNLGAREVGVTITVDGRDPSGLWVRGITSDGTVGWIAARFLSITQEQIDALPSIWVDTPFALGAPAQGSAPAAPESAPAAPAEAAPVESAPAVPAAPVVNSAPVRGFNYGGHVEGFGDAAVNRMRQAGMTWVKRQWRFSPGQNPAEAAGMINDAHAKGFRILLGIVGNAGSVNDGGYFDQYASFVGGVAAQGADAIEVWNEMNIDREWAAGSISPSRYTEMLRLSYNAIKANNPNTLVISGAPAPTGFFGGCSGAGCDDNLYVAGMAAAGAANYVDCIGAHYNEGIVSPTQTSGDPRGSSSHYSRYFQGMLNTYSRAFGGARPICFTELGYLSPEGYGALSAGFAWAQNVTVAQQAAWLDQAVSLAANSGRVRLLIVWNVDFTNFGDDPMAGFAIIRPDGSCPACELLGS